MKTDGEFMRRPAFINRDLAETRRQFSSFSRKGQLWQLPPCQQHADDENRNDQSSWPSMVRVLAAYADFIPNFRRIVIIGHQSVNADWNRFSPTNAVNKYQYGET